ncbi:hypothetical protein CRE_03568, partial [Caenorhabditis remanei]
MDPPKPFPILRLPFLAIEEVFKSLHPIEIINFSMISKRTNYLMSCAYEITSGQQIEDKTAERDGYILRRVINYLKNPIEKWKQLTKHVLDIFKKQTINYLSMTMDASVDFFFIAPLSPFLSIDCSSKMDPPKPFPILRLPFLAIEEVFKAMHPFEIINFSMISKRSKGITMQMSVCPRYSIELHIHESLGIRFLGTKSEVSCSYVMTSNNEMDGRVVETDCGRHINRNVFKYSKDPVDEWKQFCEHALEIFKKQTINVLRMTMDAFVDHNVSIIDFMNTNVKSVDICSLFEGYRKIN